MKCIELLELINSMSTAEQGKLAERCETSRKHIRNVAYGHSACAAKLAVALERETGGRVWCELLCPDVDWAFVRGTKKRKPTK